MRKQIILGTFFILTCLFLCSGAFAADSTNTTSLTDNSDIQAELINSDIPFIENEGQQDSQVDYYANTLYGTAYVTSDGITHVVGVNDTGTAVIQEQFLDANNNQITINSQGEDRSDVKVNYYQGNDSNNWYIDVDTYNRVSLGEIYPNITVKLKANGGSVEKYFYLEPGADINNIIIQILGANSLNILDDGSLAIYTANETLIMTAPVAYQDNNSVDVSYQIISDNTYGFTVTNYDPNKTLIIDPTLTYSTYLGGTQYDYSFDSAVDTEGNIYITGYNYSPDFPVTTGAYQNTNHGSGDVFVSVFNNTGNLTYSTYLGGTNYDVGWGVAVDTDGNIYITGNTESTDFPVTTDAYQNTNHGSFDVFLSVFNNTGNLTYSTYLGGTGSEIGYGVAVDTDGNIYITGYTSSTDFPVTTDAYQNTYQGKNDAFLSVFNNTGNLTYSTYLGGTQTDYGYGIAVDTDENIYITGYTNSSNFPVTPDAYQNTNHGNYDAFLSIFNNTGNLTYSTYLGGTNTDYGYGIAVDTDGNIYITGYTLSSNFPVTPDAYQNTYGGGSTDAYLSVFNNTGNLTYSTYLGGTNNDYGWDVTVDTDENIYITGNTRSTDFPVTTNAYQNTNQGEQDAFLSIFNNTRNLTYSTYLGGYGDDYGRGVAVDTDGNIYITGNTESNNFPVTTDAYQNTNHGGSDAFVAKFSKQTTSITVSNVMGKTGDTVDLTATLSNSSGSPLDGKEITFTVNGVDYSATTGVDGVATVSYLIEQSSGQYTIKATFNGDSDYKSSENTGTLTVDNETPVITSTDPVNGATNVSFDKNITVTFNEDIIKSSTFWVQLVNNTGVEIPYTSEIINGNTLVIDPVDDLAESKYKVMLHTGCVTDLVGNPLAGTSFSFSVGSSPTITATSPVDGATRVSPNKTITVTFSEAIIKSSTFWVQLVNSTGTEIPYTSYISGGNMLVISPVDDLAESWYKVMLHTGCVTDMAGNPLAGTSFSFSVGSSPTITATCPVDGATNVNPAKTITVTFNEAIRKSNTFWVQLVNSTGTEIPYTSYITSGNTLVINPVDDLEADTNYKVMLHTGCVTDLAGNPLAGTSFRFTTRNI